MVISPLLCAAQGETLIVNHDKTVAYAGDTVWFSATILGAATPSSNLHVQLLSDSGGEELQHKIFACDSGLCIAQIPAPKAKGIYWIRLYTQNSKSVLFPLTVRGKAPDYQIKEPAPDTTFQSLIGGVIRFAQDSGGYYMQRMHSALQYYSVAVMDSAQPGHFLDFAFVDADHYEQDTNLLSYKWKVTRKKDAYGNEVNLTVERGGMTKIETMEVDAEQIVTLKGMSFFDPPKSVSYQLNHGEKRDILLEPIRSSRPFTAPACEIDSFREPYVVLSGIDGAKVLDTARTSLREDQKQQVLRNRYLLPVIRDRFLLQGLLSHVFFDMDAHPPTEDEATLIEYYRHQYQRIMLRGPIKWYVDGELQSWSTAKDIDPRAVRYVEFREGVVDDFPEMGITRPLSLTYGLIIMRHGNEAWQSPDAMSHVRLQGYTRPVRWTTPDRSTRKWVPFTTANKLYLAEKAPFKVRIVAIVAGHPYYWEQIVEK